MTSYVGEKCRDVEQSITDAKISSCLIYDRVYRVLSKREAENLSRFCYPTLDVVMARGDLLKSRVPGIVLYAAVLQSAYPVWVSVHGY